jgi:squalene-associated FAD-dependent desaturase
LAENGGKGVLNFLFLIFEFVSDFDFRISDFSTVPSAAHTAASPQPSLAIIGGGVAGLAAAVAAVERGFHVELFEQAPAPGGRAGSYHDAQAKQLVDLSPHVAMGCCTNLLDFCRRTETADGFDRYATLHFFGPDGARYDFAASRWLPAPLHLMPGLRRLGYLTSRERRAIGWAMLRLARYRKPDAADSPTMGEWLRRQKQPPDSNVSGAVRWFWTTVLESALGDTIDRVSVAAARKVFVDGFMATRAAYEVLVPRIPLGEIWQRAGIWLTRRGAKLRMRARIERVEVDGQGFLGIVLSDGLCRRFDHVVSAVSWKQLGKLLGPELLKKIPRAEAGTCLDSSPITAVHLWFDRAIMDLPHAALVGRLSQWVFNSKLPSPTGREAGGEGTQFHYTVVISASHALVGRDSKDVLQEVLGDLRAIWPTAGEAKLVHHRLLTQPGAVFSARPGTDASRPAQQTPIRGLYLAGDWTATAWPATMEGAVRSGYLAIEALLAALGRPEAVLVPDLKKGWLMRLIAG